MISASLRSQLQELVQDEVVEARALSGGCISSAFLVSLCSGGQVFFKANSDVEYSFFRAEARGLRELERAEGVRVPKVIAVADSGTPCIVLEAFDKSSPGARGFAELGVQLAKLHRYSQAKFGFESDNFIGRLPQANGLSDSWGEFFFEKRLFAQMRIGCKQGVFSRELESLLMRAKRDFVQILNEVKIEPALLHGDLWSGNVLWSSSGPVLIDPAVYYGSHEVDLAFSEMFGRFDDKFYRAYQEIYPIEEGYARRREILNLYHLMTHANMFGGSYIEGVKEVLSRLS